MKKPEQVPPPVNRPRFDLDRLTRTEAASYVGLAPSTLATDVTVRRLRIPYYRAGRRCFYRLSDLDKWLEKGRIATDE